MLPVQNGLKRLREAVNSIVELDEFASPENAAIKTIDDCKALIEQYREDLKRPGLSRGTRAVLLEDLGKQTNLAVTSQPNGSPSSCKYAI